MKKKKRKENKKQNHNRKTSNNSNKSSLDFKNFLILGGTQLTCLFPDHCIICMDKQTNPRRRVGVYIFKFLF